MQPMHNRLILIWQSKPRSWTHVACYARKHFLSIRQNTFWNHVVEWASWTEVPMAWDISHMFLMILMVDFHQAGGQEKNWQVKDNEVPATQQLRCALYSYIFILNFELLQGKKSRGMEYTILTVVLLHRVRWWSCNVAPFNMAWSGVNAYRGDGTGSQEMQNWFLVRSMLSTGLSSQATGQS